ncbi:MULTISPECIES: Hsp70 family protein [Rubrivivax]|uniref:Hsp70 family protein n=1 Tax=Rubrivivax benzoatilyticus TaxID=316997 RepID=A0ABX0HUW7_9BURK|nr:MULTISPECIES: Hsp70 family protein [Rubrivivax]EGJ09720.1 putative chaperone protein [Rubrivivax benzoatilyticus JA2 = ATCC BAA-35]NHK98825.1 Hsp70 family protein [Rubrivivax benzoatilyticus]NHL24327.1 Hsp70 family protein [Rubrivivax benzoatilyticus]
MNPASGFAAIDFGTSNSGIALPAHDGVRLVELEPGHPTMPTAVFYRLDEAHPAAEPTRLYGRAAMAAYVEGHDGRLMRSMKSLLGSSLLEQATDLGGGHSVRYVDVVVGYLRHLKRAAEAAAGAPLSRVVLGRPVFFVDDDAERDAQAAAALEAAARAAGFGDVTFQYEPIAAALDHERHVDAEELVLVADIGGGTSDFSIVRVGPERRGRADRRDDILANHGVHVAGTDFDRRVELETLMPLLGYRSLGPSEGGRAPREVPSRVYFDLATWHLINTVYNAGRVAELRRLKSWYADAAHHRRLMSVVEHRLGHALAAEAERAKIEVAGAGTAQLDLSLVESGLAATVESAAVAAAIEDDLERIVEGSRETLRRAGVAAEAVGTLYFTGGSTGLDALVERIAAGFPAARRVRGDRFASVAQGLGLHARTVFG